MFYPKNSSMKLFNAQCVRCGKKNHAVFAGSEVRSVKKCWKSNSKSIFSERVTHFSNFIFQFSITSTEFQRNLHTNVTNINFHSQRDTCISSIWYYMEWAPHIIEFNTFMYTIFATKFTKLVNWITILSSPNTLYNLME